MIKVRNAIDLAEKLLEGLKEVDSAAFPEHLRTCNSIYEKYAGNPDMFVLLYDDAKLIGYMCNFPISKTLGDKMISGEDLSDTDMVDGKIDEYLPNNTYSLYLSTAAILPQYQGQGLANLLMGGFYEKILDLQTRNVFFDRIIAAAATDGGKKICAKMGMQKTRELPGGYDLYTIIGREQIYDIAEKFINRVR